ncbi:uncharacterized protein LOC134812952 [Bolinopsis microptera]|uniref:uncharacterized protein LOC134812952 n=1 Tax=Bolinopsis microptera TaxID=2820187 RepID=UPI0030799E67
MFSQKILRRKQATLSEALCHPKPWGRLSDRGKLIYCFMKLWLLLPDERRLAPFKEESLQRFRQIPTQAIPVLEHEFKLYKGAPPKMVKEKLAEDLGLEYCTVTNFFSHCPSSNSLFKNDVTYSSCLPTMVKYPSPMDTLHSFKPDFHPQLPPLSPMGRVPGLSPLHTLTALHSQELQNGLLGRSKSFLLDANKELDTLKIVAALKNRLRLLNISLHTFIDSVLLRKHNGTMVTLNDLLLHPRPYITLNPHQKEVFLTINHWLDRQPAEQLASISAFKPFDSLLFSSMEMTEIQNIISETHKFLKQYNLSQDRFATRVLSVRPEVLQDLFNSAPRTWTQLTHEQRNICHILREWINDKDKFALFLDSQESKSPKVSRTSPLPSGSRTGSAANPFIFPNTSMVKTTLPVITSSLPLSLSSGVCLNSGVSTPSVRSPPTTIIQTLATSSTSVPAFKLGEEGREEGGSTSPSNGTVKCEQGSSPMETSPSKINSCPRDFSPKSDKSDGGGSVSYPSYTEQTRSVGSQKYPRQECCHEAFHVMLQHVRETSSKNLMLCNHLEQIYKHLAPVKRDRTWTSPNTETDLDNPMKRIRMSSPNS